MGILVNGSWTSWNWDDKNRRYALWKVSPEIRYYLGGGFTGGYQLGLNSNLSLDFHAGVGYTYADYDEYTLINKVRVRKDCKTKKYWGINQLGITLIWKLLK